MIQRHAGFELVAFADIRSAEACGVNSEAQGYSSDVDMLAAHPDLDVVCICTPNGLHAEQAIRAIQARCHVVIEKPMALNRHDGERILARGAVERQTGLLRHAKSVFTAISLAEGGREFGRIGAD